MFNAERYVKLGKDFNIKFTLAACVILFLLRFCKYKENALSVFGKNSGSVIYFM